MACLITGHGVDPYLQNALTNNLALASRSLKCFEISNVHANKNFKAKPTELTNSKFSVFVAPKMQLSLWNDDRVSECVV